MENNLHIKIERTETMLATMQVNNLVTLWYSKKEAVYVANHFRGIGCKCKIKSHAYCGLPVHILTISKPDGE